MSKYVTVTALLQRKVKSVEELKKLVADLKEAGIDLSFALVKEGEQWVGGSLEEAIAFLEEKANAAEQ